MNTAAIRSFAPAIRTQLMEAVGRKLDFVLTANTPDLRQAAAQVAALRKEAGKNRDALVERVAYTWFNRLAALRFLDAQGWHPFKARVLTPATPEETQPEILKLLRTGKLPTELHPHTDLQRLNDLLDGRLPTAIAGADPQGEVYRNLILAACRFYHAKMPFLFAAIDDQAELLLPEDLLTANSVAQGFRSEIEDSDCSQVSRSGSKKANVEILGWLYQFYITQRRDAVMARRQAVSSEDIPAVTQLFTPHWIVRYLVENSLGRLWLLNRPTSRLREHMPFYVEGEAASDFLRINGPEDIRFIDPACGSGHMLTYAFDLLVKIYEEEGYALDEIPEKILTHNIFGLEICPRAAQLAQLALTFKARDLSRRAFRQPVIPNIVCLNDIDLTPEEVRSYSNVKGIKFTQDELAQIHQFRENTETFGSLIQPVLDVKTLDTLAAKVGEQLSAGDLILQNTHRKLRLAIQQAQMLGQRYHVVVANPPYMGGRFMERTLREWAETAYPHSKSDTYAIFIEKCQALTVGKGYFALITMQSWMFLKSFEGLRGNIFFQCSLTSMFHTGPGVFPELGAFNVLTTAFVFCNDSGVTDRKALFIKANEDPDLERKIAALHDKKSHYIVPIDDLRVVPDFPIVYWLGENALKNFTKLPLLKDVCPPCQGLATGDNGRFVRLWNELNFSDIGLGLPSREMALKSRLKWFPYNKGGSYRKWYGNNQFVVDWSHDGRAIRENCDENGDQRSRPQNTEFYFKEGIVYSLFGFENFGVRYKENGFVFDVSGSSMFPSKDLEIVLAFLCSNVAFFYLKALAPTVNFQVGDLSRLPLPLLQNREVKEEVVQLAKRSIELCKRDWNAEETSWDFLKSPLLESPNRALTSAWDEYLARHDHNRSQLRKNEERLNEIFIEEYGLSAQVLPQVVDRDLSIKPIVKEEVVASFLSYAVGCMMGRYSLDQPGLILANSGETLKDYIAKVGKPLEQATFTPDADGIVPVLDGEWFEDDIVARTRDFLRATFGEATLNANLRFIEEALGKPLGKYFLTDFYRNHHIPTYKKRPIYWLFQSPGKGFSALVYLHRYTKDTVNTLLNKYLRDYLKKVESRIAHLTQVEATSTVTKEKNAARKEREKLVKALKDCQEWERDVILPLAQKRLEIDLDDGVKTNYLKFGEALAPIPGLAANED